MQMIPRFPKKPPTPLLSGSTSAASRDGALKAQSSNVVGFIHDPETGHLDITFHGGRVYRYENVSTETFNKLKAAPSKGTFITNHIAEHHTFKRLKIGLRPTSD